MARKKINAWNEPDVIVEYREPDRSGFQPEDDAKKFSHYSVLAPEKRSPLEYVVSGAVERIESTIVKSPDDPLYRASSSISRRIINDRTLGSIFALGIYYFLREISRSERAQDAAIQIQEHEIKKLGA